MPHTPHLAARGNGDDSPRRSLILAGGGMRVAWQAGVLVALEEAGLAFEHADGTSGGTMNLAMLLSGHAPRDICDRWRTLRVRDFAAPLPLRHYLRPTRLPGFGGASGVIERVFPHLGIDVAAIRAADGIEGTFNVCNHARKVNESVGHRDVDLGALVAGISLPMAMPAVPRRGAAYTDSVWIKDANLTGAVKRGAEELWVLWCIGNTPEYRDGSFNQYVHMIEQSANGVLFEELDRIRELNTRIGAGDSPYGQRRPVVVHAVKPRYPLPLDPDFFLGRISAAALVAMGYRDASRYLDGMDAERGLPLDPDLTRMEQPGVGVSWEERHVGELAGAALELDLSIEAADARSFGLDRGAAQLAGRVRSPLTGDALLRDGSVSLRPGELLYEGMLARDGRLLRLRATRHCEASGPPLERLRSTGRMEVELIDPDGGGDAAPLAAGSLEPTGCELPPAARVFVMHAGSVWQRLTVAATFRARLTRALARNGR